jgi:hypothetical protein
LLVGFSGGKDSTMLASLIFEAVMSIPAEQRRKLVSVLCTDTRVKMRGVGCPVRVPEVRNIQKPQKRGSAGRA